MLEILLSLKWHIAAAGDGAALVLEHQPRFARTVTLSGVQEIVRRQI